MQRKTVKCFKTMERAEAKKEFEETVEVVELAEVEWRQFEEDWIGSKSDRRGRKR